MTTYNVVSLNYYGVGHGDNPRKYTEASTEDKGFARWLRSFLSEREESDFITYEIEEENTVE